MCLKYFSDNLLPPPFFLLNMIVNGMVFCIRLVLFVYVEQLLRLLESTKKNRPDKRRINRELSEVMSEQAQHDTVLPVGTPHTVVLCRFIKKHCSLREAGNRSWGLQKGAASTLECVHSEACSQWPKCPYASWISLYVHKINMTVINDCYLDEEALNYNQIVATIKYAKPANRPAGYY